MHKQAKHDRGCNRMTTQIPSIDSMHSRSTKFLS
ncbi:hypothetical protein LINPERHAP1_LOCUS12654 [Linum perenne]